MNSNSIGFKANIQKAYAATKQKLVAPFALRFATGVLVGALTITTIVGCTDDKPKTPAPSYASMQKDRQKDIADLKSYIEADYEPINKIQDPDPLSRLRLIDDLDSAKIFLDSARTINAKDSSHFDPGLYFQYMGRVSEFYDVVDNKVNPNKIQDIHIEVKH